MCEATVTIVVCSRQERSTLQTPSTLLMFWDFHRVNVMAPSVVKANISLKVKQLPSLFHSRVPHHIVRSEDSLFRLNCGRPVLVVPYSCFDHCISYDAIFACVRSFGRHPALKELYPLLICILRTPRTSVCARLWHDILFHYSGYFFFVPHHIVRSKIYHFACIVLDHHFVCIVVDPDDTALSLIREYLHRRGYHRTLDTLYTEMVRRERCPALLLMTYDVQA